MSIQSNAFEGLDKNKDSLKLLQEFLTSVCRQICIIRSRDRLEGGIMLAPKAFRGILNELRVNSPNMEYVGHVLSKLRQSCELELFYYNISCLSDIVSKALNRKLVDIFNPDDPIVCESSFKKVKGYFGETVNHETVLTIRKSGAYLEDSSELLHVDNKGRVSGDIRRIESTLNIQIDLNIVKSFYTFKIKDLGK